MSGTIVIRGSPFDCVLSRTDHCSWMARSRSAMPASSRSSRSSRARRWSWSALSEMASPSRSVAARDRSPAEMPGPAASGVGAPSPVRIAHAASIESVPALTAAPTSASQGSWMGVPSAASVAAGSSPRARWRPPARESTPRGTWTGFGAGRVPLAREIRRAGRARRIRGPVGSDARLPRRSGRHTHR